jgi:hypothetical protein
VKLKNKKPFRHITLHIKLKQELEELKEMVRVHTRAKGNISYGDVIRFLIKHYKESLRTEYPVKQKLLVGKKITNNNLFVSTLIKPKPASTSIKLDGKTRVSFWLES